MPTEAILKRKQTILAKYGTNAIFCHTLTDQQKKQISNTLLKYFKNNKQASCGKLAVYKKDTLKTTYINKEDLEQYLMNGYERGIPPKVYPTANKVICIETGQIFDSAEAANRYYGTHDISIVCKAYEQGKKYKRKGFHFKFYTE